MSWTGANAELVELGDIDELIRHVDRLSRAGAWDELVDLRDRCRAALERGRQLWPVAAQAEYRLALDAPGEWAASVLVAGAGRFTLGPLPEVAASSHTWGELAEHVTAGAPEASIAAHERVVRGDDLGDIDAAAVDPHVLEIPLRLQDWEPSYPLAEYHADRAEFPLPVVDRWDVVELPAPAPRVDDHDAVRGLLDLPIAWTTESNGRAEALAVRGTALGALASLGARRIRLAELSPADALARMAWTAASGGAHGRRRGMAAGRFGAWWAAAALVGLVDDWPVLPDELGEAVAELRWYAWDPGVADAGWTLRLAIEDPADGLAWAISAADVAL